MLSRWTFLASSAICLTCLPLAAQPSRPPATPIPAPKGAPNSVIIPVNFSDEQAAATVNGEKILVGEVRKLLDSRPYPFSLTEEQKKIMRKTALDRLIEDVLMRQYLAKNVPQVNPADFNKEVAELQDALKKQNKTLPVLLKELGQSEDELRRDIIARLQWKVILQRFLPDAKARGYYNQNKIYFDKVLVRVSHIMVQLPADASKAQRDRAAQTLLVWRQEIVSGKITFDEAARRYSQWKETKERGGDMGKFPLKFVVIPEISRVAFTLKIGEVSGVVNTPQGMHLLMVTERTQGEPSNFEAIKETVRETWAKDEELIPRILAEQQKQSTIKISLP